MGKFGFGKETEKVQPAVVTETDEVQITDLQYFLGFSIFFCILYVSIRPFADGKKKRAWLLGGFCAIVTSTLSLRTWYIGINAGFNQDFMVSRDFMTDFSCHFFRSLNICDLLIGIFDYREHIDLLSGWIHHSAYIWLMTSILNREVGHTMVMFFIEEIPTALLALGYIFPQYRTDMGFGSTFFLLRIVLHSFGLYLVIVNREHEKLAGYWFVVSLTMLLHVFWFRGWVISMMKKKKLKEHQ